MTDDLEAQILSTWHKNAVCWTAAVRQQQIESRRLVTDAVIIQAVLDCQPRTVLDLGCGEGWLTRALSQRGIDVLGVDAVPALIQQAQRLGEGRFQQIDYGAIATGALKDRFDVVVCNFSLFGQASVEELLQAVPHLLNPNGHLVVQTLHPEAVCGEAPYQDGWRAGSWQGFSQDFVDPAPWYFRTIKSWLTLLQRCGFVACEVQAPRHPQTGQPVSLMLTAGIEASSKDHLSRPG